MHNSDLAIAQSEVRRIFTEAVDKCGFVFCFDSVWKWGGYSQKGHAKRILSGERGKLRLIEGVDYTITVYATPDNKWGGKNKERIMLTLDATKRFLLASSKHSPALLNFMVNLWKEADLFADTDSSARKRRREFGEVFIEEKRREKKLKSEHRRVCEYLMRREGGKMEVPTYAGNIDVATGQYAIEVKPSEQWKHGLGQALAYSRASGLKPRLHLFGSGIDPRNEAIVQSLGVQLTYSKDV